ncbi:MAG: PHP domain-containing protein [Candidatus Aegiribacteria sp.]
MPLADMHVHTSDSPDAEISAAELAGLGMEEGLVAIGFVAHMDMNPADHCFNSLDPAGYRKSLAKASRTAGDRLTVSKGLEVGEPHRFGKQAGELVDYSDYDFIVGALHYLDNDGLVLGGDVFKEGDHLAVVEEYYRETLAMVETAEMDVLAHLGLFRRGLAMAGLDTSLDETELWPGTVRRILETLIAREMALELNTSGLRRAERMTYPTPRVLELYGELGGKLVTLGSDTHRRSHLFHGLTSGAALLREKGFSSCNLYRNRQPEPLPLTAG